MPPSEIRKEARESLRGNWGKAVCIILAYMSFTFALGFVEGLFEETGFIFLLIELAVLVISIPLSFGLVISFMKLKRGEDVKAFGFLEDGFSRFSKSWGIAWHTFVRMLLPIVCLVLTIILMTVLIFFGSNSSIIAILGIALYLATLIYVVSRSLLYTLAYYIGYDKPELSSKECVRKSEELMKGNRGNYFLLYLSFIGWILLILIPFVIAYSFFAFLVLSNMIVATIGLILVFIAFYVAGTYLTSYMNVATICFYDRLAKPEVKKIDEEAKIEE